MAAWLILSIVLLVIRWVVIAIQARESKKLSTVRMEYGNLEARRMKYLGKFRIPASLTTSFALTIFQTLFVILASLNVINSRNGGSFFMLGLLSGITSFGQILHLRRLIELGRKIIPLSEKRFKNTSDDSSMERLTSLNPTLRILIACALVSVILSISFFMVCLSRERQLWAFEVGMLLTSGYVFFVTVAALYQFSRCLKAIAKLTYQSGGSSDETAVVARPPGDPATPANKSHLNTKNDGVKRAVQAMRFRQFVTVGVSSGMAAMTVLIAVYIIPLYFWLYLFLYGYLDAFLSASLLLAPKFFAKKSSKPGVTSKKGTGKVEVTVTEAPSSRQIASAQPVTQHEL